jgi:hypothetical protein
MIKGHKVPLDSEWLLKQVSQEEIFEKFLAPIVIKELFCNPMRDDKKPTCDYRYTGSKLRFRDYSWPTSMDCFDVVQYQYGVNFQEALHIIAEAFGLATDSVKRNPKKVEKTDHFKADIRVKRQLWTKTDLEYWQSYYITTDILDMFGVASAKIVWLNGEVFSMYSTNNPSYVYYFGPGHYKIYYPLKTSYRFLCNTNKLQGYDQLPERGDLLVLTKSLKDVIVYYALGINAVAPQSESTKFTDKQLVDLKSRFSTVISNMDYDRAGKKAGIELRKKGIQPYFFTNGRFGTVDYKAKDVSDMIRLHGPDAVNRIIDTTYKQLMHERRGSIEIFE